MLAGRAVLAPGGVLILSVPNFAHWYVRARAVLGIFDYDQRGLLDRTTCIFSRGAVSSASCCRPVFRTVRAQVTGLPFDVLAGNGGTLTKMARSWSTAPR